MIARLKAWWRRVCGYPLIEPNAQWSKEEIAAMMEKRGGSVEPLTFNRIQLRRLDPPMTATQAAAWDEEAWRKHFALLRGDRDPRVLESLNKNRPN
ncbi:MAG: hypothetical protein V4614_14960 [Pseudomonadota bacterium]